MDIENIICLSYLGCSSSFKFEFIIHEQLVTYTVYQYTLDWFTGTGEHKVKPKYMDRFNSGAINSKIRHEHKVKSKFWNWIQHKWIEFKTDQHTTVNHQRMQHSNENRYKLVPVPTYSTQCATASVDQVTIQLRQHQQHKDGSKQCQSNTEGSEITTEFNITRSTL